MKSSISADKKSRGRPKTTGIGTPIALRWHDPDLAQIDNWRRKQPDLPSRPEAIRRLVKLGLKAKPGRGGAR